MFDVPGTEFFIGVSILVGGGILLYVGKRIVQYVIDAVATALVKSINGQLGLDAVRQDVRDMKKQVQDVSEMRTQIANLEGQIAALHGD